MVVHQSTSLESQTMFVLYMEVKSTIPNIILQPKY